VLNYVSVDLFALVAISTDAGAPKRKNACSTNTIATVSASLFLMGNASPHLIKASMHVST